MHILVIIAVIVAWGLGMIHRPATTIFLTALVVGVFYAFLYTASRPYHPPREREAVTYSPHHQQPLQATKADRL